MSEKTARLQGNLARKYLGKNGIHGISVDEEKRTVNVYVDEEPKPASQTVIQLKKDAGQLQVRTIKAPRARLV